jgi:hypothetical protein
MVGALGADTSVDRVPVPCDCADGITEAFYGRPEAFLDPTVRRSPSAWSFVGPVDESAAVAALRHDLDSGRWDQSFGHLRSQPTFDGALRLLVSR